MRNALLLALVLLAPIAASGADMDIHYVPGRGLHLADDKVVLGGYLALNFKTLDESRTELALDDLSAFLTIAPTDRFRLFTEVELEDVVHIDGDGIGGNGDPVVLERLFAEYTPFDSVALRIGKMLTPIGIWNQIHAAPLVWSVSRPFATELFFDTQFTGLEIETRHNLGAYALRINAFGQATDPITATGAVQQMSRGGGARIQIGDLGHWHVAASYLRFLDDRDRIWKNTFGTDFQFVNDRWELMSEFSLSDPDGRETEWAVYLQAVYNLGAGFHPFARYEHVETMGIVRDPVSFGVDYKPRPNMIIKLEGVVGKAGLEDGGNGFLASYSVLF